MSKVTSAYYEKKTNETNSHILAALYRQRAYELKQMEQG